MTAGNRLAGKVAFVTGAGRGIGRAIALGLATEGAAVCCTARSPEEVQETAAQIAAQGGRALALTADVGSWEQVEKVFAAAAEELGGLDIVVVNAGVDQERRSLEDSDPAAWAATLTVNLTGAYHTFKAAVPHLKRRGGGKIIAMGSGMGHKGLAGNSDYCVSKAGLWMLTRVAAQELAADKISVNELIPGPVRTQMTAGASGGAFGATSEWVKDPQDVVPMAVFLATQPDIGPTAQSFSLMRRDP